jgi:hypothetical protein
LNRFSFGPIARELKRYSWSRASEFTPPKQLDVRNFGDRSAITNGAVSRRSHSHLVKGEPRSIQELESAARLADSFHNRLAAVLVFSTSDSTSPTIRPNRGWFRQNTGWNQADHLSAFVSTLTQESRFQL